MHRYYPFSRFLRQHFGEPVHKVCIDAGFSCPNIDGTLAASGCSYCNNRSFSAARQLQSGNVSRQIELGMVYLKKRFKARKFLAYFQSFSNTHAPVDALRSIYSQAFAYPDIVGLAIATRPDCIDEIRLSLFQQLAEGRLVIMEYGLQSSHDDTLRMIHRGHDYACFAGAVEMTHARGIHTCAHVILGFPNESDEQMLQTADSLAKLPLDFLKIHDLHIVRGTALACDYEKTPFRMRSCEEYVDLLCRFLERIPSHIAIQRFFSYTPPELLAAPQWEMNSHQRLQLLRDELERRNTWQGRLCNRSPDSGI